MISRRAIAFAVRYFTPFEKARRYIVQSVHLFARARMCVHVVQIIRQMHAHVTPIEKFYLDTREQIL